MLIPLCSNVEINGKVSVSYRISQMREKDLETESDKNKQTKSAGI